MSLVAMLAKGLLRLLFPGVCWLCDGPLGENQCDFCPCCRNDLTADTHATCPHCAANIGPFTHIENGCPTCRNESFAFDRVIRLGPYEGKLREAVLRLKDIAGDGLAEVMGELFAVHSDARLREIGANLVIPIPLHWWRRLHRGYNQSQAIAVALAHQLQIPCKPRLLRRRRATTKQLLLTPAERKANLNNAFAVTGPDYVRGRSILLVDDVMTTGTTVNEAARALRKAGAGTIRVAVLARAGGNS